MMAKLHHTHAGLLLIRDKKQVMIPLTKDVTTLGRKQADIILDDPKVSGTHVEIRREKNGLRLVDLGTTNGTIVNQEEVREAVLSDQDVIEIGDSTFCFFQDMREYHGDIETTSGGTRPKDVAEAQDQHGVTVTTTNTVPIPIIQIKITKGPNEGKTFRFKKTHITIGRDETDINLLDLDSSRRHALIEVFSTTNIYLKDLGSTNGTFMGGKKISTEKMSPGSEFEIGNTTLKVTFKENSLGKA
jgi:pSer/pThr/pTyr-binding forkhead associated (FHA) protein